MRRGDEKCADDEVVLRTGGKTNTGQMVRHISTKILKQIRDIRLEN
jgi:hypothetical protein